MNKKIDIVLGPNAKVPTKGSVDAAGYDLYNAENVDYLLKPGERHLFTTNIKLNLPSGYYGRIAPRSGLALKYGIDTLAGVCDSDYRDWYRVLLINSGQQEVLIKKGDRIAQLIIESYLNVDFHQCDGLSESNRGTNGFGSTGV